MIHFFKQKCLSKNGWNNGVGLSNEKWDKAKNGLFRWCLALSNGKWDNGIGLSNKKWDNGIGLSKKNRDKDFSIFFN